MLKDLILLGTGVLLGCTIAISTGKVVIKINNPDQPTMINNSSTPGIPSDTGCSNDTSTEKEYQLTGSLTDIQVSSNIDVQIKSGSDKVVVEAAQCDHEKLVLVTNNGQLKAYQRDNTGTKGKFKIYVGTRSSKSLAKVKVSGNSTVDISLPRLMSDRVSLNLSGNSGLIVADDDLDVDLSGNASIIYFGDSLRTLRINASGNSEFNGRLKSIQNTTSNASGNSTINLP